MKRLLMIALFGVGLIKSASAQTPEIMLTTGNVSISNTNPYSFSFDLYLAPGNNYNSSTSLIGAGGGLKLNFDVSNVTVQGATNSTPNANVISSNAYSGEGSTVSVSGLSKIKGNPPANASSFGLAIIISGVDPILANPNGFKLCRVQVLTTGPIPANAVMTLRGPGTPISSGNGGSGFSYTGGDDGYVTGNTLTLSNNPTPVNVRFSFFCFH